MNTGELTMFEHSFWAKDALSTKQAKQDAYKTFLDSIHQDIKKFPFTLDGLSTYKGRPTRHTVSGFGGYFNADNVWTVFIAYRCGDPKHTIQHCWSWDSENQETFNYRVMEFVN